MMLMAELLEGVQTDDRTPEGRAARLTTTAKSTDERFVREQYIRRAMSCKTTANEPNNV